MRCMLLPFPKMVTVFSIRRVSVRPSTRGLIMGRARKIERTTPTGQVCVPADGDRLDVVRHESRKRGHESGGAGHPKSEPRHLIDRQTIFYALGHDHAAEIICR
jgi:hypothetical protein